MNLQLLDISGTARHPSIWRMPSIAVACIGLVTLIISTLIGPDDWYILGFCCTLALIITSVPIYRGFRDGAVRLLTDPFLTLVGAFVVYFLLGTMVLVIGSQEKIESILDWYPTNANDAVRITAMNLLGLATTLFTAGYFPDKYIENSTRPAIALFNRIPAKKIFWFALAIGIPATFVVLSADFFQSNEVIVSGLVRVLSGLVMFAILIGLVLSGRNNAIYRIVAISLAITSSFFGLLLFNKSALLMPLLIVMIGLYLRTPSIKLVIASIATIFIVFLVVDAPIGNARTLLKQSAEVTLSSRFEILRTVFGSSSDFTNDENSGARFCYTVPQVAAVDLYEKNQGGDNFKLLPWIFVPRFLIPSKPIMTSAGSEFNMKVTGSNLSSTGMGVFISGYYNLGWFGLFLVSALAGWVLAAFSAISRNIVETKSVIFLPICLLSIAISFRVDGDFIEDYMGTFGMIMMPFLTVMFLVRMRALKRPVGGGR